MSAYTPNRQMLAMLPAFRASDQIVGDGGGEETDRREERISIESDDDAETRPLDQDLFQIAIDVPYREMIRYFLLPHGNEIAEIRSRFQSGSSSPLTLIAPVGIQPGDFDKIRNHLYEVQVQLFYSPRGLHCHLII